MVDGTSPLLLDEFLDVACRVRNWGRWGDDDELGTLNFIDAPKVIEAAGLVRAGRVFPLGAAIDADGPQDQRSGFRSNPIHFMTVDGGDAEQFVEHVRGSTHGPAAFVSDIFDRGPMRFNDDYIAMPLQASTQWDALAHVYYHQQLYNGFPASSVTSFGATRCGINAIASHGVVSRGVLLDIARHRNVPYLPQGEAVGPEELEAIARRTNVELRRGDILCIRTGWYSEFKRTRNPYVPRNGLSWRCAEWLHDYELAAVAADNRGVEGEAEIEDVPSALHMLCLRDMGMPLGELWDFDLLAEDCELDDVYEFQLSAAPLNVTGGVGSPLNPVAIK